MAKVFYVVEKWRNFTKPGHTAVDQIVAIILGAVRSCKKQFIALVCRSHRDGCMWRPDTGTTTRRSSLDASLNDARLVDVVAVEIWRSNGVTSSHVGYMTSRERSFCYPNAVTNLCSIMMIPIYVPKYHLLTQMQKVPITSTEKHLKPLILPYWTCLNYHHFVKF